MLQARGYKVTIQKFDPYINIDSETLNPYEHGDRYFTGHYPTPGGTRLVNQTFVNYIDSKLQYNNK